MPRPRAYSRSFDNGWTPINSSTSISFEFTVLCAAHGMAITYLIANRTLPGMPAQNPDPRTTDDKFVIEVRTSENGSFSDKDLEKMLKETGMIELDQKEI